MKPLDHPWAEETPAAIDAAVSAALIRKRAALDAIALVPDADRTFQNTIAALERAGDELSEIAQWSNVLASVHPDAALRKAYQAAEDRVSQESIEMDSDPRLWHAVRAWEMKGESLDAIDRKLAGETIRTMRRMGFELPDEAFQRLKKNRIQLATLEQEFELAINAWEDAIEVTREQLDGLPERYIEGLSKTSDGRYRITLEHPDLFPFMRHARDDAARRELAIKNLRKGGAENLERLARMVRLRQENARLLGYATHADYQAEIRMARDAHAIDVFLRDLITKLTPAARHEMRDCIALKQRTLGLEKPAPIHFHELPYWSERLLNERYAVDSEKVKEYFPLTKVVEGMLAVFQELLGVTFTRVADATLWHPDVELYEVRDEHALRGHFALDLYPRSGKYGHAASFSIRLGRTQSDGTVVTGFLALVCNFARPTASHPSLLTHDDVETLFHEFGHVMHAILSGGRWQSQNGLFVAFDFVEAPSQIMEEWPWHPAVLARISAHVRTGEPLPADLLGSMLAARHHLRAVGYLAQAVQALYDLTIHAQPTDAPVDGAHLAQTYRDMKLEYEAFDLPDDSLFPAGWGHMADYDAGYYGYLWSKVYALDLYSRFASNPLDTAIGRAYREAVLAPGASVSERESVTAFLGREPSNAAFLEMLGILE
ncbi:MAG: Zn-dependent oligopeptidase [Candidatus Yanofskybacteria bacterium]|nr:Zn-dependent oligopeptidase [Candidatus Yanofskybacteria bacterium]